jgi:monoamine oxidase
MNINPKVLYQPRVIPRSVNRRRVIQAIGAASIAAATPRLLRAQNKSDVIVIGAGLSGLAAALLLEESGASVQVIEGRNRIGGRVQSFRNIPGDPEAGGTAFGPGYARLVDAARTRGVELIDITPVVPFFFDRQLVLDDEFISTDAWPAHAKNPFPKPARAIMPWMYLPMLIGRSNPLETGDAWLAPENAGLDIPLHEYLAQRGQSDATIQLAYNTNPQWGSSSYDVSALMPLSAYAFSSMQRQLAAGGKVMGYTAKGGNQAIPEAMAAALKTEVRLDQPVTGIRATRSGSEVHCAGGTIYRADRVVCSVPFSVLKRIRIEPMLTGAQAKAVNTLESQVINQVHFVAKKPFWEEDGMTPNMFTNSLCGMVLAEHKGERPEDITSLTAWIRGHNAAWMDQTDEQQAIAAVIADIERLRPAAKGQLEVLAYKSWYRDPFSSGDWAVWQPGQVSELAAHVATPHGPIHFCGEHTAVSNRGMEGAMESGERVAFEVMNTL